jgi:hypothetical protein
VTCASCGSENRAGREFSSACGSPLALVTAARGDHDPVEQGLRAGEAAEIFERLRARPWLECMHNAEPELATASSDGGIDTR